MSIPGAVPLRIELQLRTPHGEPVLGAEVHATGGGARVLADEQEGGRYRLVLPRLGDYQLFCGRRADDQGFDHRTLRATLFYATLARDGERPGLRVLQPRRDEGSRITRVRWDGEIHHVESELDYLWFTPIGTPPRLGNDFELLIDGEEAWGQVADAIEGARRELHLTTWSYQPTAELRRPDPLADPEDRAPHTVHDLLEARAEDGVTVRLLLWDWPVFGLPEEAKARARDPGDNFEVLEQANPTRVGVAHNAMVNKLLGEFKIGSYHQKTVIVDGQQAFVGGMNIRENDWDTRIHALFDPKRAAFERKTGFRQKVRDLLEDPDHPPRHDFYTRLEGPVVADVATNFQERWNYVRDHGPGREQHTSEVHWTPSPFPKGRIQAQIVRTMPEPWNERGILDVFVRAIEKARKLIFIEDQYFRSTLISDAIADAVRRWNDIELVVVTNQLYADDFLAAGWARECFERVQKRKPDFTLYALRSWAVDARGKGHMVDVDNHSKLMIVDDLFLTTGSCNVNDRGFEYEGELNVAIVDAPLVRASRVNIFRDLLGPGVSLTGDIGHDCAEWRRIAAHNRTFDQTREGAPQGLIYPFEPQDGIPLVNSRLVW